MKPGFIIKIKSIRKRTACIILGILFVMYFIIASLNWGRVDSFNMVMIFFGSLWIFAAIKISKICILFKKLPKIIRISLKIIILSFILSFIIVESIIIFNMRSTAKANADYVIVLGCQVVGTVPSVPLLRRVNAAVSYLRINQNTKVVVSGGQGPGEDISEAEAMKRILLRNGISENRILVENKSKSTRENFLFSDNLYSLHDKKIVVVSTDYHMFRAVSTAKKLNYKNIEKLPSKSVLSVLPVYLLREYAAVTYYKLTGRI